MKSIAIIFLATLIYTNDPSKTENLYSWQLQFHSYDKCTEFYNKYQAEILNGLLDHGREKYNAVMEIDYLACGMVEMDFQKNSNPKVIGQKEMYKRVN
ncbi:MAG: hypothetical protein CMA64_06875 [Euryarchaeota archaeon]|nr:hypothetical protein [Euryarchaeota archaeon]|tara:strand:+ start:338 stop:631 length:294 start_codon:yes stop_codon:yes gene_type:complete